MPLTVLKKMYVRDVTIWSLWSNYYLTHRIGEMSIFSVNSSLSRLRKEHDYQTLREMLHKLYRRIGRLDKEIDLLVDCFKMLDEGDERFFSMYDALQGEIESFPCYVLTESQWFCLSSLMLSGGVPFLGYLCHEKAIDRSLSRNDNKRNWERKYRAYLENGNYAKAKECLQNIKTLHFENEDLIKTYSLFLSILEKNVDESLIDKECYNEDYANYLSERDIIISGPAPESEDYSTYSSEHDPAVICFNYKGNKNGSAKYQPNITYFNGENSYDIHNNGIERDYLKDMSFVLTDKSLTYLFATDKLGDKLVAYTDAVDLLFTWGQTSMVQKTLYHLIFTAKKPVHVIKTTLFLGKQTYDKAYVESLHKVDLNQGKYIEGAGMHNPITNFAFIKNLYNTGWVLPDANLEEILSLSLEQYMRRYEDEYFAKIGIRR